MDPEIKSSTYIPPVKTISKELTLKYVPDLRFRLDETYDRMDETKRLFGLEKVKRDLDM